MGIVVVQDSAAASQQEYLVKTHILLVVTLCRGIREYPFRRVVRDPGDIDRPLPDEKYLLYQS